MNHCAVYKRICKNLIDWEICLVWQLFLPQISVLDPGDPGEGIGPEVISLYVIRELCTVCTILALCISFLRILVMAISRVLSTVWKTIVAEIEGAWFTSLFPVWMQSASLRSHAERHFDFGPWFGTISRRSHGQKVVDPVEVAGTKTSIPKKRRNKDLPENPQEKRRRSRKSRRKKDVDPGRAAGKIADKSSQAFPAQPGANQTIPTARYGKSTSFPRHGTHFKPSPPRQRAATGAQGV